MDNVQTDESYKFWDRVAGWSKAESAVNSTLVRYINSRFGIQIMPDDTVLDYGCGTGTITLRIAQNVKKVFGVDISGGMLKRAQQNLKAQNVHNATFMKITALNEMFPDNSFQLITMFNVLQYLGNRKGLFNQFYKLLESGGRLVVAVPCFKEMTSFGILFVKFLRFVRIMPRTYFFSIDEITREITDCGFTIIENTKLTNLPERFLVVRKE